MKTNYAGFWIGLLLLAVFSSLPRAQAQGRNDGSIGCGNVSMSVEGITGINPGTQGCYEQLPEAQPVPAGTTLTIALMVKGVMSGSYPPNCQPGSCPYSHNQANIICYAEGQNTVIYFILQKITTVDLVPYTFSWTPTVPDVYDKFCTVQYQGDGTTGPQGYATTQTIYLPVV